MARRYLLSPLPQPGKHRLPPEVSHHLGRVMRARVDDTVDLFDGEGKECQARIQQITGSGKRPEVWVETTPYYLSAKEPKLQLEVAFAAPKGNRAEWIFEHGTEIGISTFHPLGTERAAGNERNARWSRILEAATGQCDRAKIPHLRKARDLAQLLADPDLPEERYLAHIDGPPLGPARNSSAILLVGPEGGLSPSEIQRAVDAGFEKRCIGVTTLRTETAVLCGATLLLQGERAVKEWDDTDPP